MQSSRVGNRDSDILPNILVPASAEWHRVRIQLYPDGTCGFALDGREVWRSHLPVPLSGRARVALIGKTVGTRVLVGEVRVGAGVKFR